MSRRAAPLPPEERRAQILRVTEPLVLQFGSRVTTRQIADAAGLAEGTLFRLYPTKNALLHDVVLAALDPDDTCAALALIDQTLPLTERLELAVVALRAQVERISALMTAMRDLVHDEKDKDHQQHMKEVFERQSSAVLESLEAILAPDREALAIPIDDAAKYLRSIVFITQHPLMRVDTLSEPNDLVAVWLHGIHRKESIHHKES